MGVLTSSASSCSDKSFPEDRHQDVVHPGQMWVELKPRQDGYFEVDENQ